MSSRIVLAVLLVLVSGVDALADKKKEQAGIGVRLQQDADEVKLSEVVPGYGAWHAGFRDDDVLVSVDGTAATDRTQAGNLLVGDACTLVTVVVKRGNKQQDPIKVWRAPRRGDARCLGVYQLQTKVQVEKRRELQKLSQELLKAWKDKDKAKALQDLNEASDLDPSLGLDVFMGKVKKAMGVDVALLETHANQVVAMVNEQLPEKGRGRWEIRRPFLRITDVHKKKENKNTQKKRSQDRRTQHTDFGNQLAVLTVFRGQPTRLHPMGCLGTHDNSQFRGAEHGKVLVLQGDDRFKPWSDTGGAKPWYPEAPTDVKKLADICKRKGVWHQAPRNQRNRIVLVFDLTFIGDPKERAKLKKDWRKKNK